ncbi:hypothetical protein [Dipodfec virus UOA04_Rod_768]|nr:hypothetical protein [Dipodfec virus UOA04_Rod_768]
MEMPKFNMRPLWETLRIGLEQGIDPQVTVPTVYDEDVTLMRVDPDSDIRQGRMDIADARISSARTSFEASLEAREASRRAANSLNSAVVTEGGSSGEA